MKHCNFFYLSYKKEHYLIFQKKFFFFSKASITYVQHAKSQEIHG